MAARVWSDASIRAAGRVGPLMRWASDAFRK